MSFKDHNIYRSKYIEIAHIVNENIIVKSHAAKIINFKQQGNHQNPINMNQTQKQLLAETQKFRIHHLNTKTSRSPREPNI